MKSTQEIAELLEISSRQVRKLIENGSLNAQKIGRVWLIDEKSAEQYLTNRRRVGRPRKNCTAASTQVSANAVNDADIGEGDTAVAGAGVGAEAGTEAEAETTQTFTGAHALIRALEDTGVTHTFGIPGGRALNIYDTLAQSTKITHILMRHEQGATHAADGYARACGKCGTVIVTSGPGATNTVTGIATAYMDSVPLVVICGQVPLRMLGTDAFQESDIIGITMPIVKHSFLVKSAEDIPAIVAKAYHIALTGRPGPVVIDIPCDIAADAVEHYSFPKQVKIDSYKPTLKGHSMQIKRAAGELAAAKNAVILAGAGILRSGAEKELFKLAHTLNAPVATTLCAKGAFPENDELSLGVAGIDSSPLAQWALFEADLVFAVGTRIAERLSGKIERFIPNAKIIHTDIDPAEISKNLSVDLPIVGDAKYVLEDVLKQLPKLHTQTDAWLSAINLKKNQIKSIQKATSKDGTINPLWAINVLDECINKEKCIVTTGVGNHQVWAAQTLHFNKPNNFLSSGGAGTMGFDLPAAIGAQIAHPDKKVICIVGDGSVQMNIQEMAVAKELNLNIKVIVLRDDALGMVKALQDKLFNKRHAASEFIINPDLTAIAKAYGWNEKRVDNASLLQSAVKRWLTWTGPSLLEVNISSKGGAR